MPLALRSRIVVTLDRAGLVDLALRARRWVRMPLLPIVTYHRVGDPRAIAADVDEGVVDVTEESFARQLALLVERFRLVGVDDVRRMVMRGEPLPKNAAMITFDDGYRECKDVVLRMLRRHGAKAVFFISTDHTTRRRVFWWDRVAWLVKRSAKTRVEVTYPEPAIYDLSDRGRVIAKMLDVIKETRALDVERYLDELAKALDVAWTRDVEAALAERLLLTWDELRELRRAGMDVQSHTRTHRVLQTLTPEELRDELAGSRRDLETELGEEIRAVAYPVGFPIVDRPDIARAIYEAGYELGFSSTGGTARLGRDFDPLDIQRLWADPDFSPAWFRASIAFPRLTTFRR
jgi:peptidoglycan/xylan/chitin deacetylase (PgdA/CDA1 family)